MIRLGIRGSGARVLDPVTQSTVQTATVSALSSPTNFEGAGANGAAPSDANLAVGPNHIVQIVNLQLGIYDKTGASLPGFPKFTNVIWAGFGGICETHNDGDGIVRYDRQAKRWIVSQLAVDADLLNFHECLSVSQSEDPAGAYYRYDVDFQYRLHDYPKIALWPDGWYMSANSFLFGFLLEGTDMCAWERSKLLVGDTSAKVICVVPSGIAGMLPSDWDGSTPPPNGAPNYFIGLYDTASLVRFQMTPNYQNPAATIVSGPTYIAVAPFNLPCGDGGDCIPQKDTTQVLSTVGERLMNRLAYRNFGAYESIVVNHSVAANNTVGIRWYEIRNPGSAASVYQQGTYVPDSDYRWMGSMAMDQAGNMALGYSKSGPGINPGIFLTSREAGDPSGTLRAEQTVWTGSGSQLPDLGRWGDYSSIETDPVDDCTFWYTTQYLAENGTFNWHTRIANYRASTCSGASKTNTTTAISSDTPDPSVTGQAYVVAFSVTPAGPGTPTGTVTVSDAAGATCSASVATANCTLPSSSAGSRTLTATYAGDANFNSSSGTAAHTINRADTITTITSDSPDPSTVGQTYAVNFTVTAKAPGSGTPTGTVTVGDGAGFNCSASAATGTCSSTTTTAGTRNLVATYGSDANFNGSTVSAPHTTNTSGPAGAPSAPSNLKATPAYGSAGKKSTVLLYIDLSWQDNSNNEDNFVIERWKSTSRKGVQTCALETTFTAPANAVSYRDSSAATSTCKYRVAAKNTGGTSAFVEVVVTP